MSSAATPAGAVTAPRARADISAATTTSSGSGTCVAAMIFLASPTNDASASDLPTGKPLARRKVLRMPPPTTSRSTFFASAASSGSLVETLALVSASSSAAISGPAQASGAKRATPCVVASARCAVPKASFTYISQSLAIRRASASSSAFSPTLKRQFSSITTWPGRTSTPSSQSRTRGISFFRISPIRTATGARESSALKIPSFGRPRCEVTISAAPLSSARRMPGTEARMRVSSVMRPLSSCGTLRSARIKTRLPRRSRSCMRRNFIDSELVIQRQGRLVDVTVGDPAAIAVARFGD